jgi:PHS family inorganic phosphate transporter-like MFS transporter
MMAAVFLMQPLGRLLAYVVGLVVLLTVGRNAGLATETDPVAAVQVVDRIWRYVVGFGAILAVIALWLRLTIPESPRFTLDVAHDAESTVRDIRKFYNIQRSESANGNAFTPSFHNDIEQDASVQNVLKASIDNYAIQDEDDNIMEILAIDGCDFKEQMPDPFSSTALFEYFWKQGNIKWLLGTSICWFLLDFAFYGLGTFGTSNPRVIAQIWSSPMKESMLSIHEVLRILGINNPRGIAHIWSSPVEESASSIYEVLRQDSIRSIITISTGSLLGSIILIKVIDYIPRKSWLVWSFIGMTVLFASVGGSHFWAAHSGRLTMMLYILCQLLFNLGPKSLTFIMPAEIFPTRYRATCFGISAATGKLGSVVVQLILTSTNTTNCSIKSLPWSLIVFSFAMALGAVFAWAWIPEVQDVSATEVKGGVGRRDRRYEVPSKTLEELAIGRIGLRREKGD